ncbi:MAG: T9SS type A sorting domain-containing protein, partial [Ruminococcus sp.]|nr:T9SS type A sorting domain-containing protein [Ruminococcus sp.]
TIAIYPNPTTGIVNIKCSEIAQISVFNAFGQLLLTGSIYVEFPSVRSASSIIKLSSGTSIYFSDFTSVTQSNFCSFS